MVTLKAVDITDFSTLEYIQRLYETSFPLQERRLWNDVMNLLSEGNMQLAAIITKNGKVGFIIYWQLRSFRFIEHFAIDTKFQSQGFGSAVIELMMQDSEGQIIVETEIADSVLAQRRLLFYERCGFTKVPFAYRQPPYHATYKPFPMQLMSRFAIIDKQTFEIIKREIYTEVYSYTGD